MSKMRPYKFIRPDQSLVIRCLFTAEDAFARNCRLCGTGYKLVLDPDHKPGPTTLNPATRRIVDGIEDMLLSYLHEEPEKLKVLSGETAQKFVVDEPEPWFTEEEVDIVIRPMGGDWGLA